jgi:hypothetical protein
MSARLWILYHDLDSLPLGPHSAAPEIILGATVPACDIGENGLIVRTGVAFVDRVATAAGIVELTPPARFEDRHLNASLRRARSEFRARLTGAAGHGPAASHSAILFAVEAEGKVTLYHHVSSTEREMLALDAATVPAAELKLDPYHRYCKAFEQARDQLAERAPLLNSRWAYVQWRANMELERKFTFTDIPDTWALAATLFDELYRGDHTGFYPEPDMGLQVFDYENYLFEVTAPEDEMGYISFIPQVDALVTVKRKWFRENAELRRETLWPGEHIKMHQFDRAAHQRVAGELRALPPFRRKRLDVNYESLTTGHVFGVYFDICTTIEGSPPIRFGQVEVEYCRTRTLQPLKDVEGEFEAMAGHVRRHLEAKGVAFQHNLYSKLDFARDAAREMAAQ